MLVLRYDGCITADVTLRRRLEGLFPRDVVKFDPCARGSFPQLQAGGEPLLNNPDDIARFLDLMESRPSGRCVPTDVGAPAAP